MSKFYTNKNMSVIKYNDNSIDRTYLYRDINLEIPEPTIITKGHFTNVPFISLHYFETKVNVNSEITIPFYVTDYLNSDHVFNDYSKLFLVKLEYGDFTVVKTVRAGDNEILLNVGNTLGMRHFTLECTDLSNNIKSFKQVMHLLVVDPEHTVRTYAMTEGDLAVYSLNNEGSTDSSAMSNNIVGLNQLLSDKKAEGYDKVVLLGGTYMVNMGNTRDKAINIPTQFTLDMNGAKIKQKFTEAGTASLIVSFGHDRIDSHVINGTVEGDFDEHPTLDESGKDNGSGEGYDTIAIGGAFCSLENMEVGYATGYSIIVSGESNNKVCSLPTSEYVMGYVNSEGILVNCDFAMTTGFGDIHAVTKKFISANTYKGYGGYSGWSEIQYVHFYDSEKNYMHTVKNRQYSLVEVPVNAYYVRTTIFADESAKIGVGSGSGYGIEQKDYIPLTCGKLRNIHSYDTRTCAIATGIFNFMLVEGCTFDRCGQKITPAAIDIEDGYQYATNYFFKNNTIGERIGTVDLIMTYGHNVNINSNNFRMDLRAVKGLYLESGDYYSLELQNKNHMKSGFHRIKNCVFTNGYYHNVVDDAYSRNTYQSDLVSNCTFNYWVNFKHSNYHVNSKIITFRGCTIDALTNNYVGNGKFVDSTHVVNGTQYTRATYIRCDLKPSNSENIGYLYGDYSVSKSTVSNLSIKGLNTTSTIIVKDSVLNDVDFMEDYWTDGYNIIIDNCTITTTKPLLNLKCYGVGCPIKVTNCTIISTSANGIVYFSDDRINASQAEGYTAQFLVLKNNTLKISNSAYIVKGISSTNVNPIKIHFENNVIEGSATLYDTSADSNPNIIIENV